MFKSISRLFRKSSSFESSSNFDEDIMAQWDYSERRLPTNDERKRVEYKIYKMKMLKDSQVQDFEEITDTSEEEVFSEIIGQFDPKPENEEVIDFEKTLSDEIMDDIEKDADGNVKSILEEDDDLNFDLGLASNSETIISPEETNQELPEEEKTKEAVEEESSELEEELDFDLSAELQNEDDASIPSENPTEKIEAIEESEAEEKSDESNRLEKVEEELVEEASEQKEEASPELADLEELKSESPKNQEENLDRIDTVIESETKIDKSQEINQESELTLEEDGVSFSEKPDENFHGEETPDLKDETILFSSDDSHDFMIESDTELPVANQTSEFTADDLELSLDDLFTEYDESSESDHIFSGQEEKIPTESDQINTVEDEKIEEVVEESQEELVEEVQEDAETIEEINEDTEEETAVEVSDDLDDIELDIEEEDEFVEIDSVEDEDSFIVVDEDEVAAEEALSQTYTAESQKTNVVEEHDSIEPVQAVVEKHETEQRTLSAEDRAKLSFADFTGKVAAEFDELPSSDATKLKETLRELKHIANNLERNFIKQFFIQLHQLIDLCPIEKIRTDYAVYFNSQVFLDADTTLIRNTNKLATQLRELRTEGRIEKRHSFEELSSQKLELVKGKVKRINREERQVIKQA